MPCLLLIGIACPRFALAVLFLFTGYLGRAYESNLWPFLGFFFMPFTTLAYAWAMNSNNHSVSGIYMVVVIVAVLADLGVIGGGAKAQRQKKS